MTTAAPTASGPRLGVSLSGAEFGTEKPGFSNRAPGTFGRDYTYNTERSVGYFCEQGLGLIRIPVRWERLQPRLGEALDGLELSRLRVAIGWVRKHGGSAIIDLHNYGRYTLADDSGTRVCVIDQSHAGQAGVTREHFADIWRRMAETFKDDAAIHGYGLMNEPHDMGSSDWKAISQLAVNAIRTTGDTHLVLVAGNEWSKAQNFAAINGKPWISDPCGNIAYEAHCYFDREGSGKYASSFAAELAADANLVERGSRRLTEFVNWCRLHQVSGFVGEFGMPRDAQWQPVLDRFLQTLDEAGMDGCAWGAGEWWGNYPLSIQPSSDFHQAAPQMESLRR